MTGRVFPFCTATWLIAAALAASLPHGARAEGTKPAAIPCAAPADLSRITTPLPRTAKRLAAGEPVTIVAIGSSSTAGAGASSPAASYPSRLAVELSALFPRQQITVINRGVNGEDAAEMLARLEKSVIAEKPDLVLWQVGTNAILRDQPLGPAGSRIHQGLVRLKAIGADVVLIDPQFAPKVLAKADVDELVDLLAATAKRDNVSLFRRFAVMRHWREVAKIPFEAFLSPDELHMNDWSYACIARIMAGAIAEAASRATLTAQAGPR
ncbi:MAG: SGNH/GDSL hydrolase family protein [Pseudorhodoplanes sp.]|nr:SGNH/GDSL hydrolase family protein [Pseudorhodoplanes sp.]